MWLRDLGLEGLARRSCGSPVPVCTCAQSLQHTQPQEARAGWCSELSAALSRPQVAAREGGSHLLSSSSSSSPAGLDWRMLLLLVPMETPSHDAEGEGCQLHPSQGAPQTLAAGTADTLPAAQRHQTQGQTPPRPCLVHKHLQGQDKAGQTLSQSQPEM